MKIEIAKRAPVPSLIAAPHQFRFIDNPGFAIREQLADMLDHNRHIPQAIDRNILHQAPYVLVVIDDLGQLVAGCSIKSMRYGAAEFGFTIVSKNYRRLGLGFHMTQRRIAKAWEMDARLIYSMVRDNNEKSRSNLKKSGFRYAGKYLHRQDAKTRLDWYIKILQPMNRRDRNQLMRTIIADRVAVIY